MVLLRAMEEPFAAPGRSGARAKDGGVDIETARGELYGVPLAEFTGRRAALARAAKQEGGAELARTIGGLRKPTTSAWVVNMLARHRPELVDEVAALGDELRDAQDALDAPRLRDLGKQRSALVRRASDEAVALAQELGTAASAAVREEVAQTLHTAMIDADASALVASGTLVKPLSVAGWGLEEGGDVIAFPTAVQRAGRGSARGEGRADAVSGRSGAAADVEPEDAAGSKGSTGGGAAGAGAPGKSKGAAARSAEAKSSAGSDAAPARSTAAAARKAKREAEREQLQRDFEEAEAALTAARDEAEQLRVDAETLAERRSRLRDEVEELTRQLREAEGALADVETGARGIRRSRDDAKRSVTSAQRALARARRRLE